MYLVHGRECVLPVRWCGASFKSLLQKVLYSRALFSLSLYSHVLSIQPNTFAQTILNKENLLVSRLCFFLFINMEKVCHCTRFASPSNANPTRERLVFFSVSISKHYIPRRKRRVGGGSERVESKFITNLFCTCVSVSERERENK